MAIRLRSLKATRFADPRGQKDFCCIATELRRSDPKGRERRFASATDGMEGKEWGGMTPNVDDIHLLRIKMPSICYYNPWISWSWDLTSLFSPEISAEDNCSRSDFPLPSWSSSPTRLTGATSHVNSGFPFKPLSFNLVPFSWILKWTFWPFSGIIQILHHR